MTARPHHAITPKESRPALARGTRTGLSRLLCSLSIPVAILLLLLAGCSLCGRGTAPSDALTLHQQALVADLHSDTPLRMVRGIDITRRQEDGHMDLPRLAEGGIDLQVFASWVSTNHPADSCRLRVDTLIDSVEAQLARSDGRAQICRTAAEARRIIDEGRTAIFLGIENGVALEHDLANLDHFYRRGIRYLTLTHTASSDWCISSADTAPAFDGLTNFGHQVVRRMNDLGMIIDISHAHPLAVKAVLETSRDPVIASHSCARSLCDHDRNLTDEEIRAVARNGGMIGINFYKHYLSQAYKDLSDSLWGQRETYTDSLATVYENDYSAYKAALKPLRDAIRTELDKIPVDVGTVVDHIDHIVALVGPNHVGLGSDYDGVPSVPTGLEDCTGMPAITAELLRRGYSAKDVRKILGGNFMRVFERVCGRPAPGWALSRR